MHSFRCKNNLWLLHMEFLGYGLYVVFVEPYPDLDWSYIPGELPAKKDVQDMKNVLLELKEGEKEEDIEEAEEEEDQKSDEDEVHMEFSWDIGTPLIKLFPIIFIV